MPGSTIEKITYKKGEKDNHRHCDDWDFHVYGSDFFMK